MPPLRHVRKSRRLSHKSPMDVADYDWQDAASPLRLLRDGCDVEITPTVVQHLIPPSPSACTTSSSVSPPAIITHLPFAPGSSHTRNRKDGHIPRPPNAFMVFRSWLWNKDNLKNVERDNRNVSRIAGRYWNQLTEAERAPFRSMAEEAKARHAQLYPEYRYSPGSQKKHKAVQRRSQRSADAENEKCKMVADLLLGGVIGRDLAKYLGDGHNVKHEEEDAPVPTAEMTSSLPRNVKRPAAPRRNSPPRPRTRKQRAQFVPPVASPPPFQQPIALPTLPVLYTIEDTPFEATPTPGPSARTPDLVWPPRNVEDFVATDDIPFLSLDGFYEPMIPQDGEDVSLVFPSHLSPGARTVFAGIKPEAAPFIDSCVLGAYTTTAPIMPSSAPFTAYDVEPYSQSELVPLGSPVFINPFEPSTPTAGHAAMLGTLDQLFGQPISPLTPTPVNPVLPRGIW